MGVRKTGNVFEVALGFTPPPVDSVYAAVLLPFAETVQLPVFGLPASVYQYSAHGEFSGASELTEDNSL